MSGEGEGNYERLPEDSQNNDNNLAINNEEGNFP